MHRSTHLADVFTIGYESLKPARFIDLLKRSRVEVLVDVRELPISRKPGFAKNALVDLLAKNGIEYLHAPEFGCPRDVRHAYRESGDWTKYTREFMRYLTTRETALAHFAEFVTERRCCLLCLEEDFNFCHRKYVAEEIADRVLGGARINHLTGPIQGRVVVRPVLVAA
ncbi:MAG: DUF488 domain-containing protein [Chthoniobacteraceae bacterium]